MSRLFRMERGSRVFVSDPPKEAGLFLTPGDQGCQVKNLGTQAVKIEGGDAIASTEVRTIPTETKMWVGERQFVLQ